MLYYPCRETFFLCDSFYCKTIQNSIKTHITNRSGYQYCTDPWGCITAMEWKNMKLKQVKNLIIHTYMHTDRDTHSHMHAWTAVHIVQPGVRWSEHQLVATLIMFLVCGLLQQPSVMVTSVWLQLRTNRRPRPRPHPLLWFVAWSFQKGLQFSKMRFTAAWHALKFLSVFLLTSVDCLRRGGILEGWWSARGLVSMVTNPWAGFHLAGRKPNYLQTENSKIM